MMEIEYIYRPPTKNVSIEKGFDSIINRINTIDGIKATKSFVKSFGIWPIGVIYNIIRYAIKSYQNKVFHISGDIQYVGCLMNPRNTVITIHDLVSLHNLKVNTLQYKIIYYLWYYYPIKNLKYICCISEYTKADLIRFFPFAEGKITVIPSPVGDIFYPVEKEFNSIEPRILHIGTRSNKNLDRVIQALAGMRCHLCIIGFLSEEQKSLLEKNLISYSNGELLSDEELIDEYQKADIVSFPSLFEGFGMPVIEAQVVGRPVVSSILEPMRTIAGPNAILADPYSVESIRNSFLKIINDKISRELCVKSGFENAKNYSTASVVEKYLKVYKMCVTQAL